MSRSNKKGAFVDASLMKKVQAAKKDAKKKPIKTWSRRSTIFPDFVGLTFQVHNGRDFVNVFVTDEMVGYKLGEFVPTRTFKQHSSNNKAEDARTEAAAGTAGGKK